MRIPIIIVLSVVCMLSACQPSPPTVPAPLGDYATLELLANAYREVAKDYPVQPHSMRPIGRKQFVQQVFATAGYDYTATLESVARAGVDVANQDHRDLVDLLFLPHQGLNEASWEDFYSDTELAAVQTIRAAMR